MTEEIDDPVKIEFSDMYRDVFGPPGARGMSESGHLIEPPELSRGESQDAISAVWHEAEALGIKLESRESVQKSREQRFDFGTVNEIARWLSAVAASGAAVKLLTKADVHITRWLKNRAGRSVTITKGDWTISTKGDVDVKAIIKELEKKQDKNS
jgi:hypothetical protein